MSFLRLNLTPEKVKEILQRINDMAHESLTKGEPIVLARHDRKDPHRFEIIADSFYDQELEGKSFIFEKKDDFKAVFPQFAQPAQVHTPPNTEIGPQGKPVAIHQDPYIAISAAASVEAQDKRFDARNVFDGNPDTVWAVNERGGAEHYTDLGRVVDVGAIWVKWYKGDKRQYKFSISYFNFDTEKHSERKYPSHLQEVYSSGKEKDYEVYNLSEDGKPVELRYLVIKVMGNTTKEAEKDLAAITLLQITKASAITPTKVLKQPDGEKSI